METVQINGSTGEGGGQILRTSLALACITGRRLHIENIRAARRNPGLARQHISCVQAACQICSGKCTSCVQGSKELDFEPGAVRSGDFYFDIGSAGSTTLVIQTILPALFLADKPSTVTVVGGTHNPLAPPFDFFCESFLPAIATAGFFGNCRLEKFGFFPAGGGKITIDIQPGEKHSQKTINFCAPSRELRIDARIYTARLAEHIALRQRKLLQESKLDIQNIRHIEVTDSDGPGNAVCIRLCGSDRKTVFTAFGMRGRPSQDVISEVVRLAENFLASGAAVDRFLADQLLIYMAMGPLSKAGCYTTNELSSHLLTNIEIIKKFLDVDFCVQQDAQVFRVSCLPI